MTADSARRFETLGWKGRLLLHRVLPAATGVYAGGIGELFQSSHLLGCQHDSDGLGSLTPGPSGEGESKAPRFSGENLGG